MMMVMNQLTNRLQETPGEQSKLSFCKIQKGGDKKHFCELLWKNKEIFSLFKPPVKRLLSEILCSVQSSSRLAGGSSSSGRSTSA